MKISTWLSELSRKARIGLVISICWLLIILLIAVDEASGYHGGGAGEFLSIFIIIGMLPVIIGWGVRWIKKS